MCDLAAKRINQLVKSQCTRNIRDIWAKSTDH